MTSPAAFDDAARTAALEAGRRRAGELMESAGAADASAALEALVASWGADAGVLSDLAVCRFELGDTDTAVELCRSALALDPDHDDAAHNLAAITMAAPAASKAEAVPATTEPVRTAFPSGHFYSPVVDARALGSEATRVWPPDARALGIDFRHEAQTAFCRDVLARYLPDFDYPETVADVNAPETFFQRNEQFGFIDSRVLFAMLRHLRPANVIEVGSGFSSLLMADVNRRFLGGATRIHCVEPYPRPFLAAGIPGIDGLTVARIQDAPIQLFDRLGEDDILFIDTSHVAKTGSDVNHILFEILPRIRPGVAIHIHDIFLPGDYPKSWVLNENRSWNEQYVVQALLMFSNAFEVLFGSAYAGRHLARELQAIVGAPATDGGSLWLRRT